MVKPYPIKGYYLLGFMTGDGIGVDCKSTAYLARGVRFSRGPQQLAHSSIGYDIRFSFLEEESNSPMCYESYRFYILYLF